MKQKEQVYRVVLAFPLSVTRSVFVRAKSRETAEKRALRRNPKAIGIDRSPFPLN
jgi:hypothetical protein